MAPLRIKHGDWVFVGDGRKALLLRNEGDPDLLDLRRVEVREDDNPPSREQGTDKPGRTSMPIGPRSSVEPTDWTGLKKSASPRQSRSA
jgi:protein required for attachment to host cells